MWRIDRSVHAEFPAVNEEHVREYIRAETKWNGYSFNAQCFVDLVADEYVPEGEWRPRHRVVSRQELCPLIPGSASIISCSVDGTATGKRHHSAQAEAVKRVFLVPVGASADPVLMCAILETRTRKRS
jgi:hypothetical protein